MYNLLIALGASAVGFGLGWLVVGSWVAGFLPAFMLLIGVYLVLARRSGKQLEAIMKRAMKQLEQGRVDQGRKILEEGFALGKWQFLVDAQIHAQLGSLDYLQRNWKSARKHLEQAWARQWQAKAMLAAIDHRDGNHDRALEILDGLRGPGGKDPLFWGLYAWIALQAGNQDKALNVLNAGLEKLPDSEALKAMANQVRNNKKVKTKAFAPGWYQFFPEHVPKQMMMGMQQGRGKGYPMPRR